MNDWRTRAARKAVGWAKSVGVGDLWRRVERAVPAPIERKLRQWSVQSSYAQPLVDADALEASYVSALKRLQTLRGHEALGDYLEFGVCHGTSTLCMDRALRAVGATDIRLFGFDSFEGLPPEAATDDGGVWAPGHFNSDLDFTQHRLTTAGVDMDRVVLTKGWFSETLTPELREQHRIERAGVIMVDCDIYTSSIQALRFCAPLIQDVCVVYFDDWNSAGLADQNLGERKAFDEFMADHPDLQALELPRYDAAAAVFLLTRN
jgi:hypothetical protein